MSTLAVPVKGYVEVQIQLPAFRMYCGHYHKIFRVGDDVFVLELNRFNPLPNIQGYENDVHWGLTLQPFNTRHAEHSSAYITGGPHHILAEEEWERQLAEFREWAFTYGLFSR